MASGQKDYWRSVSPEKSVFSGAQTPIFKEGVISLAPANSTFLAQYTVPANHILHINTALVCCDHPGIQTAMLYLGGVYIRHTWFDSVFCFPFSGDSIFPSQAGTIVGINVTNNNSINNYFYASWTGFLQELVT